MKNENNRFEIPLYSFLLLFCAVFFYGTFQIRDSRAATLSDAFMPRLTIIVLAVLLAVLLVKAIIKRSAEVTKTQSEDEEEKRRAEKITFVKRLIYVVAVMAVSVWLMDKLGFIISMSMFLLALFIGLAENGKPKWKIILPLGIFFPLAMFVLYLRVFSILLPTGILQMLS